MLSAKDYQDLVARYQHGDERNVWRDLSALGPEVREEPFHSVARAVCQEMTRRSRHNLVLLMERLQSLRYEFWSRQAQSTFRLTRKQAATPWLQSEIWRPQPPDKRENAPLRPLALEVWGDEIGSISMLGEHPLLSPQYLDWPTPNVFSDPMQILPEPHIDPFLDEEGNELTDWGEEGEVRNSGMMMVSKSDMDKASLWTDPELIDYYGILLPCRAVDAELKGFWRTITFIEYVRLSFTWGGFPGWSRYPQQAPMKEIEYLREGLFDI